MRSLTLDFAAVIASESGASADEREPALSKIEGDLLYWLLAIDNCSSTPAFPLPQALIDGRRLQQHRHQHVGAEGGSYDRFHRCLTTDPCLHAPAALNVREINS